MKYDGHYEHVQEWTFKMKITQPSAATLEFKCPQIKIKVKYTVTSGTVINGEILEQAAKYHIIYKEVQIIIKILSSFPYLVQMSLNKETQNNRCELNFLI